MSVYVSRDNFANSNSSKLFASAVIQEFTDAYELSVASLPFQGETGIWVLQESTCPAVIIEPGYITNYKDLAYLRTTKAQEIIAVKILAAVENYAFAKEKKEAVVEAIPLLPIQNITAKKTDTVPTITLKNYEQALILLDGKTISNETLKKVKPESIESVRVIKDKAALIQYGEKGKNGVVIIETKEKNIIFKDLTITVQEDSTTTKAVVSGNIKIHNNASAEKQPMYVVDGKIITNEFNLNSINPNDIESVNVLKGKTALDKYGEPGINGVVEITTKGKKAIKVASLMKTPDNNTDTAFVIAH